ncbi:MAG: ion transporter [Lachnospiraceae bacterium]|nr:ion transporter [Lachnospiraceae bacterium]
MSKKWIRRRKRVLEILEVGHDLDYVSRAYDFLNVISIIVNLAVSILYTYSDVREQYGNLLLVIEGVTVAFFAIDYVLRLWTARFLYPKLKEAHAIRKYIFSFNGIIDILSFLPYYLPIVFPMGTIAFRMIRIVRIFRLFRINSYYDSLTVIKDVIYGKRQQLISSVFIILVLMIGSSLCMYSLEHEAQPEVFENAFSGIWWAASTLLTVGYGDIYPITAIGKMFGIFITFLGVGMVAIPTGIISAGFVDQYSTIKKKTEYGYESDMHFIKINIVEEDKWVGKQIAELQLPKGIIVAIIKRKEDLIIPRGDVVIEEDDTIVLGAEPYDEVEQINLKEVVLKNQHKWTGKRIRDLDISRHSVIVLIKRRNKALIPNGNMTLQEGDRVFLYTNLYLGDVNNIDI